MIFHLLQNDVGAMENSKIYGSDYPFFTGLLMASVNPVLLGLPIRAVSSLS